MKTIHILGVLSVAAVMQGCTGYVVTETKVNQATAASEAEITSKRIIGDNPSRPAVVVREKGAWVGGKTMELRPDAAMPTAFNVPVTMIFPGRVSLSTVAERITKTTGVPVRVKPDVFLPSQMLQPRGVNAQQMQATPQTALGGAGGGLPSLPAPGVAGLPNMGSLSYSNSADFPRETEINFVGRLSRFLDILSAKFGVNWEYKDGAIQIYRLVTKTLALKENPGNREFSTDIGKTGTTTTGGSSGSSGTSSSNSSDSFSANMGVKTKAAFSAWDNVKSEIESVMTQAGRVSISESTGTIVITDTRDVVNTVTAIVEHENAVLTKQVAIRIDVMKVSLSDKDEYGINWNVVYNQLSSNWRINVSSPSTLASTSAGSMGLSILTPDTSNPNSMLSRLAGSEALFNALHSVSKNVSRISNSVIAKNRQPVPLAITDQVTYLASTTPATSTTTTGTTSSAVPGLTPGVVTTGYLLNVLPTVMDNGSVMMQLSLGLTDLVKLGSVSTGQGASLQLIQTPEVSGSQSMQNISLKAGQTLVISAYESNKGNYDRNGLSRGAPVGLGGSFAGGNGREATIILVTPVVMPGV